MRTLSHADGLAYARTFFFFALLWLMCLSIAKAQHWMRVYQLSILLKHKILIVELAVLEEIIAQQNSCRVFGRTGGD